MAEIKALLQFCAFGVVAIPALLLTFAAGFYVSYLIIEAAAWMLS